MPRLDTATRILCELIRLPQVKPTSPEELVQMACLLATKLEDACSVPILASDVVKPAVEVPAEDLARDETVLEQLRYVLPSGGGLGVKRALWAHACGIKGIGRRAFDSSRMRLMLSGRVRQAGKRYILANTDAP